MATTSTNTTWNKVIGLLLRRYYQNEKAREVIAKADRSFSNGKTGGSGSFSNGKTGGSGSFAKGKQSGTVYLRIMKLVRKLAKIVSDAVGFFIDDLQMTKEEAILHEFLKVLPYKEFVRTGRTVTLDDGTVYGR